MDKAAEFRQRAEECQALAGQAPNEKTRLVLVDMAKRWLDLAQEREKLERDYPEIFRVT